MKWSEMDFASKVSAPPRWTRRQAGDTAVPPRRLFDSVRLQPFSHADKDCLLHSIKKCVILHKVKESQSLTGKK